ncbi:MAG: RnfABCDGE type electron transport complex subunit D [Merdibacter sp.]
MSTAATPVTTMANTFNWMPGSSEAAAQMLDQVGGLGTLMTGWHPGAIGETCGILILIVGVILAWRQVIDWRVPLVYLLTIAVAAASALIGGVAISGRSWLLWYPLVHVQRRRDLRRRVHADIRSRAGPAQDA